MKKLHLLLICSVFIMDIVVAQQKPHYTQYILNNYILNPALSGIENYTDVKISHRHQWIGINDAPVTTYITIQGPIGKKDYKSNATTLFNTEGNDSRGGKNNEDNNTVSAPHHGVGLQIISDQAGPFNNFSAMGTYAYHLGISAKTNLSAGIGLGISKLSLQTSKLFFGPDNPIDPSVFTNYDYTTPRMDMNAGLWLYSDKYFVGLAGNQLIPHKIDFSNSTITTTQGKLVPHIFATAGYRFLLSDDVNMIPSIMVKKVSPVPVQIDFNTKIQYQDLFWVGGSYRSKYGFAAMAGMNILNMFTVSYSYDYSTTKINTVSKGTHEILIGFILGNKYSDNTCPKNIW